MDHLWSPWRYRYVSSGGSEDACLFCRVAMESKDRENYVIRRGAQNFVMLNRYPYTSGHLMIAPYHHIGTLEEADSETLSEMILLTREMEIALRRLYNPGGLNIGLNIGKAAGAGVAGHIHMHALPRWAGDVNFMTVVGETRVLPEDLDTTYNRLVAMLDGGAEHVH